MKIKGFINNEINELSEVQKEEIVEFLFNHLEQYGDECDAINKCLSYASKRGGSVWLAFSGNNLVGVSIFNETGMQGYIPENILVYIAVHKSQRGKGLGKQIIQAALSKIIGDVALHVEKDNPAKYLYEKLGFTNPYLEMRLKR
ncbi:MAG: GNAT family N-acetyltransferase [Bacteroidia bacterium]